MNDQFFIAYIPTKLMPSPPKDQQECLKERCELCHDEIWISIKKREFRAKNPGGFITACMVCVVNVQAKQGEKLEVVDILKLGDGAN